MQLPKEKPISQIISTSTGALAKLHRETEQAKKIKQLIATCWTEEPVENLSVVHYKSGQLKLAVNQASLHHRLKFKLADLVQVLRQAGIYELKHITLVVIPPTTMTVTHTENKKATRHAVTSDTSITIQHTAERVDDKSLSQALNDLANTLKR